MKRVLMMLVAGTVLSGLAAAYAGTLRQPVDAATSDEAIASLTDGSTAIAEHN